SALPCGITAVLASEDTAGGFSPSSSESDGANTVAGGATDASSEPLPEVSVASHGEPPPALGHTVPPGPGEGADGGAAGGAAGLGGSPGGAGWPAGAGSAPGCCAAGGAASSEDAGWPAGAESAPGRCAPSPPGPASPAAAWAGIPPP